ncbi:hypothetical protein SLS61_010183, partial [Didymella pomorum]
DGFGTHESLEVLKFCYENNIVLCRLPSHSSHKLQPCDVAFTPRNIRGAWNGAGLYPLRPDRVLRDMQKPQVAQARPLKVNKVATSNLQDGLVQTPVTPVTMDALLSLRLRVKKSACAAKDPNAVLVQKLANAAKLAFAKRNLLFNNNRILLNLNNKSRTR